MLHLSLAMQAAIVVQIIWIDWFIFQICLAKAALEVDNVLAGSPADHIPLSLSDGSGDIPKTNIS